MKNNKNEFKDKNQKKDIKNNQNDKNNEFKNECKKDIENKEENIENEEEKEEKENKENNLRLEELENKNKDLEQELNKMKDTLMRTLAELDNTRRRAGEENEKTAKYAISKFAEGLIPVMEDFYLAFDNVKQEELENNKVAKNFFEGIKLTKNELKKVFDQNNLSRIFPLNEKFDPELHNAIMQVESDEEEGTIVQVMQAGYKIKDRLLRPALVGVSKGKNN